MGVFQADGVQAALQQRQGAGALQAERLGDAQARARDKLAEVAFARAALREVIGRELGRVSASVDSWPPVDLATIEARTADGPLDDWADYFGI